MIGKHGVLKGSWGTNTFGEKILHEHEKLERLEDSQGKLHTQQCIRRFKLGEACAVDVAFGDVPFSFHICFSGGLSADRWVHQVSTAVSYRAISLKH